MLSSIYSEMKKYLSILAVSLLFFSCTNKYDATSQKVALMAEKPAQVLVNPDTIHIDLYGSAIHWAGTKMRGMGKHEGELELQSAYLLSIHGELKGGYFVADMSTIGVTDIPENEPLQRKKFNEHMNNEDFFDVEKFPTSTFSITDVEYLSSDSLLVSGNLSMKDITRNIQFTAIHRDSVFHTTFRFDRFKWNIAYGGNWIDKTLVDKDVELSVHLVQDKH